MFLIIIIVFDPPVGGRRWILWAHSLGCGRRRGRHQYRHCSSDSSDCVDAPLLSLTATATSLAGRRSCSPGSSFRPPIFAAVSAARRGNRQIYVRGIKFRFVNQATLNCLAHSSPLVGCPAAPGESTSIWKSSRARSARSEHGCLAAHKYAPRRYFHCEQRRIQAKLTLSAHPASEPPFSRVNAS